MFLLLNENLALLRKGRNGFWGPPTRRQRAQLRDEAMKQSSSSLGFWKSKCRRRGDPPQERERRRDPMVEEAGCETEKKSGAPRFSRVSGWDWISRTRVSRDLFVSNC